MFGKLSLLAAAAVVAAPAFATITVSSTAVAPGAGPTNLPATFDFNSATPQYSGTIYQPPSQTNVRTVPDGSTGGFAAVGPTGQGNNETSAILNLSAYSSITSISFLWGTVDSYNYLDVLGAGNSVLKTFKGGANQGAAVGIGFADAKSTRLVTLTFTGSDQTAIKGLQFSSPGTNAFEFDNIKVNGAVPEPATWAMMVGGFGLLGAAARRTRKPAVRFA